MTDGEHSGNTRACWDASGSRCETSWLHLPESSKGSQPQLSQGQLAGLVTATFRHTVDLMRTAVLLRKRYYATFIEADQGFQS